LARYNLAVAQLTRAEILDAAIGLLDGGPAALSMRSLADALDVTPAALYYWFDNKDALLDAVADHVAKQIIAAAPPDADWRAALVELARSVITRAQTHPVTFGWVFTTYAKKPPLAQVDEAMIDALLRGGFDDREALLAKGLLWRFIVGHLGLSRVPSHIDTTPLTVEQYPRLHQVAATSATQVPDDFFEWGLHQLVSKLEPTRPARRRR
jgi:TetR/AcrR family tetracycline transcriptional repressor